MAMIVAESRIKEGLYTLNAIRVSASVFFNDDELGLR
jgi:thiamine phosphate synthase YjbQ (UPF0047 family)